VSFYFCKIFVIPFHASQFFSHVVPISKSIHLSDVIFFSFFIPVFLLEHHFRIIYWILIELNECRIEYYTIDLSIQLYFHSDLHNGITKD
jgi:hypothetical protein